MKKGLIILFTLIAIGAFAQTNPNSSTYSYETMSQAIRSPKKKNFKFSVMENGTIANFVTKRIADGYKPDGVLNIAMADGASVAVRDISQTTAINAKWFGMVGDSATDETAAWKKIRDFFAYHPKFNNLYIPEGKYRITDTALWRRGIHTVTDGPRKSILVRDFISAGHGSLGVWTFESVDSNSYITGIDVEGLGFISNASLLGHDQWGHQIALLGTDGAKVHNCWFYDFRGDGIYIGAGKDADPANKRYNKNVQVWNSDFDGGPLFRNRNAISIIDGDGITIHDITINHVGNDTLTRSVGGIDFERNSNFANARAVELYNIHFTNCNSLNTSAITYFCTVPPGIHDNAGFFHVYDCDFKDCYWGVSINNFVTSRALDGDRANVLIEHNNYLRNRIAVRVLGSYIGINRNYFKGDANNFCQIQVGLATGDDLGANDVEVGWNILDSCGQLGGIELNNVRNVKIHDNNAFNRRSLVYIFPDGTDKKRHFEGVKIFDNGMFAPALSDVAAGNLNLINAATGFNLTNYVVNNTCEIRGNRLGNRVGLRTGVEFLLPGMTTTGLPTVGSWDAGNELFYTPNGDNNNNKLICTVGGTFPLAGDTAVNTFTATSGSNMLIYKRGTNVLASKLRDGQYVYINSDTTVRYKIAGVRDTSAIYLDKAVTASGSDTLHWIKPAFRIQSLTEKYTSITSNIAIAPGNQDEFLEFNLANRAITLSYDLTTLAGIKKTFRNNTTGDEYIYMGVNGAGDTVRTDGKTDSIRLFPMEDVKLESTGPNTWRIMSRNVRLFDRSTTNPLDIVYSKGKVSMTGAGGAYVGDNGGAGIAIDKRIDAWPSGGVANGLYWLGSGGQGNFNNGDYGMLGRLDIRFAVNGGALARQVLWLHKDGKVSLDSLPGTGTAKWDFNNMDSLGIRLPNMLRSTFANQGGKAPGLMVYGTSTGKILYSDNAGGTQVVLDSISGIAVARNSISLTTTGTNGAATYNSSTGVLNIPTIPQSFWQLSGNTISPLTAGNNISTTGQVAAGSIKVTDGTQGSGKVLTSDASGNGTWQTIAGITPPTFQAVTSNVTNATTTAADVTGMSFVVQANQSYHFHVVILASLDNTGGVAFKWTVPSGAGLMCTFQGNSTSSTAPQQNYTQGSGTASGFIRFTGANGTIVADGYIQTSSTAGVLQLQFNPVTAGQTATIYGGTGTGMATSGHIEIMQPILQ